MVRYMKCPRCELNYIDGEKQEFCDICIKEMKGLKTDADELEEEEAAELPTLICPICGENMMRASEKMCDECRKKAEFEEEESDEEDDDDEWREYLDDDETGLEDLEEIDMSEEFGEEFDEPEEEEKEEFEEPLEDEDMEYVTGDEIYLLGDDDDDEDDEGEDDF